MSELSKGQLIIETTLLDHVVTRDGRISKKLFNKEIPPYITKLEKESVALKQALREFDDDDNWIYKNPPKYIGKYDPRVFATKAIKGEYLENTKDGERTTSSQQSILDTLTELQTMYAELKYKLDLAVEQIQISANQLEGVSLAIETHG